METASLESTGPAAPSSASAIRTPGSAHGTGRFLRYAADRGPVSYVLLAFAVHVWIWAVASPVWAAIAILPLVGLGMFVSAINHHHQHVNTFRSPLLNRLYEIPLSLQTGIGPYAWVLHHNLGHHRNYLNQPPCDGADEDESRWKRPDGAIMGRLEYAARLVWTHQRDIFRVGRKHPKILRHYLWMKLPVYALLAVMFWFRPENTLLVFLVPAFLTLFHTSWVTYAHHAGCEPSSHLDASHNRINPLFNRITGNLGYHTAHHKRPGTHWSLLPALHEQIKDGIPAHQIETTFW